MKENSWWIARVSHDTWNYNEEQWEIWWKQEEKINVFKTSSSHINEAIPDDEEMALFTRRFNKMFKNGQFPRTQSRRNFGKKKNQRMTPSFASSAKNQDI